jgi:hypothetical protein
MDEAPPKGSYVTGILVLVGAELVRFNVDQDEVTHIERITEHPEQIEFHVTFEDGSRCAIRADDVKMMWYKPGVEL